jgi:hypothetical protein
MANGPYPIAVNPVSGVLTLASGSRRWVAPHYNSLASTSVTFTVGRVYLMMFELPFGGMIDAVSYIVGATSAGNMTAGIYGPTASLTTDTCAGAALLGSSASTAQGTTNAAQLLTLSSPVVAPAGIYYAALEGSDATGTFMRNTNQPQVPNSAGWCEYYDRSGGYGAQTDPCPAVTQTTSNFPGLRVRLAG